MNLHSVNVALKSSTRFLGFGFRVQGLGFRTLRPMQILYGCTDNYIVLTCSLHCTCFWLPPSLLQDLACNTLK